MKESLEKFEDRIRGGWKGEAEAAKQDRCSRYCDLIFYRSTIHPELTLAMRVSKPEKPGYIKVGTHGWHMTIPKYEEYDHAMTDYLLIDVDMRGRVYSDGKQDCNGWELYDVIDAVEYAKKRYAEYIRDPDVVFFESGSGGGGNAFAICGKFPDYFAHVVSMCGISDYALWYREDEVGEFRDEMDVWVGDIANEEAYAARSGLTTVGNLCTPIAIVHGETDIRVPSKHSRLFVERAKELGKGDLVKYMELAGVGTRSHWGNITPEQSKAMDEFVDSERLSHARPVTIPRSGEFTVCGYLFTKEFSVVLDDIGRVAKVTYDLDKRTFSVTGAPDCGYTLRVRGN